VVNAGFARYPPRAMPNPVSTARRAGACALALVLVLLLVPAASSAAQRDRQLYVSLGDSYATGAQVTGPNDTLANTNKGFADLLPRAARKRGYRLELVNFGCGGETTTSILRRKQACAGPAPGAPRYGGRTQVGAAERFLRRNRGDVGLITVSIGGNDVTACARAADPISCVVAAVDGIKKNVKTLVRRLRAAAGPKPRIVGITYPDVILGAWVTGDPAAQNLAQLSVVAFKNLINPALKQQYESVKRGRFVDVTAASGAYEPFTETVTMAPYGVLPKPVAEVCRLTYFCEFRDIHARTVGYRLIADLIAETLPRRRG
jgi:lysophospholipase L1-like esterase